MTKEGQNTTILRKDSDWSIIDEEPCRVIRFTPMATIENGKVLILNKIKEG